MIDLSRRAYSTRLRNYNHHNEYDYHERVASSLMGFIPPSSISIHNKAFTYIAALHIDQSRSISSQTRLRRNGLITAIWSEFHHRATHCQIHSKMHVVLESSDQIAVSLVEHHSDAGLMDGNCRCTINQRIYTYMYMYFIYIYIYICSNWVSNGKCCTIRATTTTRLSFSLRKISVANGMLCCAVIEQRCKWVVG